MASDYGLYLKAGDRSPKWNEFIEPGFQAFDSGNYPTSYVFLSRAYDQGCRDGLVLTRLGLVKESQGRHKEAALILAQAKEALARQYPAHPYAKSIHAHLGRVLYQADDYAGALPELKKAAEGAEDFTVLFLAGQLSRLNKQFAEAKGYLSRALKAEAPQGAAGAKSIAAKELMIVSFELKDLDACLSYADQVLAAMPQDAAALAYRQKVEQERLRQKEREAIEKLVR